MPRAPLQPSPVAASAHLDEDESEEDVAQPQVVSKGKRNSRQGDAANLGAGSPAAKPARRNEEDLAEEEIAAVSAPAGKSRRKHAESAASAASSPGAKLAQRREEEASAAETAVTGKRKRRQEDVVVTAVAAAPRAIPCEATAEPRAIDASDGTGAIELAQAQGARSAHRPAATSEATTTVHVSNLPYDAGEGELRSIFGGCGEIAWVHMRTDPRTGESRGFAHIDFTERSAAGRAVKLAGTLCKSRRIRVDFATGSIRAPSGGDFPTVDGRGRGEGSQTGGAVLRGRASDAPRTSDRSYGSPGASLGARSHSAVDAWGAGEGRGQALSAPGSDRIRHQHSPATFGGAPYTAPYAAAPFSASDRQLRQPQHVSPYSGQGPNGSAHATGGRRYLSLPREHDQRPRSRDTESVRLPGEREREGSRDAYRERRLHEYQRFS